MTAKCPHCSKTIDVVSAKELDEEYGINSNRLQHAKSKNRFPEPWLSFPNRDLYLREDIDAYVRRASAQEAERGLAQLRSRFGSNPNSKVKRMLDELEAELSGSIPTPQAGE